MALCRAEKINGRTEKEDRGRYNWGRIYVPSNRRSLSCLSRRRGDLRGRAKGFLEDVGLEGRKRIRAQMAAEEKRMEPGQLKVVGMDECMTDPGIMRAERVPIQGVCFGRSSGVGEGFLGQRKMTLESGTD